MILPLIRSFTAIYSVEPCPCYSSEASSVLSVAEMRNIFACFYEQTVLTKDLFNGSLVSFDTNVLLHSFRWSINTQNVFVESLRILGNRLWLTHHAGLEYHRHRSEYLVFDNKSFPVSQEVAALKKIRDGWSDKKSPTQDLKQFAEILSEAIDKISTKLDETGRSARGYETRAEGHSEVIGAVFEGKCGQSLSEEETKQILANRLLRRECGIPPGLTDQSKASNQLGDLLIWEQLKSKARDCRQNVIFVTDENKIDWWAWKKREKWTSPELLEEFRRATEKELFILSADQFIKLAAEWLVLAVAPNDVEAAIDEVKNASQSDLLLEFGGGEYCNLVCSLNLELPESIALPVPGQSWMWTSYQRSAFSSTDAKVVYSHVGTSSQPVPNATKVFPIMRGSELTGLEIQS